MGDLNHVTVEVDSGAVTLAFMFRAVSEPSLSDLPMWRRWVATEQEALLYGAQKVAVGEWDSFTVEKRYGVDKAFP